MNLAFWGTFKLLWCLNSRDKASKSDIRKKDSKFDDNFNNFISASASAARSCFSKKEGL